MKNLIILGAGGMGREVYWLARRCKGYGTEYMIKGFLDFNDPNWDTTVYPPILGVETSYQIDTDDVFICSVGDVKLKKKICETIIKKRGAFINLIDPNSYIGPTAKIGNGCLVFHDAHIGSEAEVGDFVMLQSFAALGHDVKVGDFSRIDPKVSCVGGAFIGNSVTLHTMCVINQKVIIEDYAVIGAMSFVIRKVKQGKTVFGIPAKEI